MNTYSTGERPNVSTNKPTKTLNTSSMQPAIDSKVSTRNLSSYLSYFTFFLLLLTVLAGTGEHVHSQFLKLGDYVWDDYSQLRNSPTAPQCDPNIDIESKLNQLEQNHNLSEDEFGFINEPFNRVTAGKSLYSQIASCQLEHQQFDRYHQQVTQSLILFREVEQNTASFSLFILEQQRLILVIMLFATVFIATIQNNHISFRPVHTESDHRLSSIAQLTANALICISGIDYLLTQNKSGIAIDQPEIVYVLVVGALMIAAVSLYALFSPLPAFFISGADKQRPQGKLRDSFLSIPIYCYMIFSAAYHFFISQSHPAGLAILFTQMFELSGLYLQIALYIWVGMLLRQSSLGTRLFKVFSAWKLPPEALAIVAILLMALPTAYTGASGIIIIAMGSVVYQELRNVGTRRQLALAVTAMTGSSGVVLRPCLLIVGIAMLNKEVVTDELYYWGTQIFALTLIVFSVFILLLRSAKKHNESTAQPTKEETDTSIGDKFSDIQQLFPYFVIIGFSLSIYHFVLDAHLDEFTAPFLLPVIVILILIWERSALEKDLYPTPPTEHSNQRTKSSATPVRASVYESTPHIGALLMIMASSYAVGGSMEFSGFEQGLSYLVDSQYLMMAFLLLCLVIIGMLMDPFGALVLVSISLAPIAYQHGIDPVHFWMICLVAFELGYLSPPVAINHVFTRQVVGEKEVQLAMKEGNSFYYRNERLLLPLLVMGTTLLLVAYGPIIFA
ncbi:TRAP transporter large permease subunit [Litoribacillus peritrichatus]|uniref:TRAP transporter large permease subunit n=1 Tax=Litoribacillus peritrichatus TaxID=718191 RepID=A0ABP7M1F7_9GAMM